MNAGTGGRRRPLRSACRSLVLPLLAALVAGGCGDNANTVTGPSLAAGGTRLISVSPSTNPVSFGTVTAPFPRRRRLKRPEPDDLGQEQELHGQGDLRADRDRHLHRRARRECRPAKSATTIDLSGVAAPATGTIVIGLQVNGLDVPTSFSASGLSPSVFILGNDGTPRPIV